MYELMKYEEIDDDDDDDFFGMLTIFTHNKRIQIDCRSIRVFDKRKLKSHNRDKN